MAIGSPSQIGETDDVFARVVRASSRLERHVIDPELVPRREDDLGLVEAGPGDVLTVAGLDDELDVSACHRGFLVRGRKARIDDYRVRPIGVVVLEKPLESCGVVDIQRSIDHTLMVGQFVVGVDQCPDLEIVFRQQRLVTVAHGFVGGLIEHDILIPADELDL
ncbi:hypothetical protein AB0J47_22705 [Nocardia sp. NPDC049737]|uniref:hypothetical protein n=1 Tax=Nocardia sp. NPDC049737 TaxID=3154358 RepID=UPI0034265D52